MSTPISVVSSKATQVLLDELTRAFEDKFRHAISLTSLGGVEVAARVRSGEHFEVVVLSSEAVDNLLAEGRLVAGTKVDLARSDVAVAVRAGGRRFEIDSEEALRGAVLEARSIGRSTGPSGVRLAELFARWKILDQVRDRLVTAPAGTPVGALVARGEVELGFQQLSELLHVNGVEILGSLPAPVQITTTFSAAVASSSAQAERAQELLAFLASPATAEAKRREGMEPV